METKLGSLNSGQARYVCPACRRAGQTCFCSLIKKFDPGFKILFIVHPKEARNRVGTVRIAHLSLIGSELIIAGSGASEDEVDSEPKLIQYAQDPAFYPLVLFPAPNALPIEQSPIPMGKKLLLIVIDGTWRQAKKMVRRSSLLTAMNKTAFIPDRKSQYQFRVQPNPFCLSTVEAVHTVLERLRPKDRAHDSLLEVFNHLVETQVRFEQTGG